jgi:hypothetical protein
MKKQPRKFTVSINVEVKNVRKLIAYARRFNNFETTTEANKDPDDTLSLTDSTLLNALMELIHTAVEDAPGTYVSGLVGEKKDWFDSDQTFDPRHPLYNEPRLRR